MKTLPERMAVFGISALPPFHLEILAAVSKWIEVNLFLMNPCREYWGDLLTRRETRKIQEKARGKEPGRKIFILRRETAFWLPWACWAGISLS